MAQLTVTSTGTREPAAGARTVGTQPAPGRSVVRGGRAPLLLLAVITLLLVLRQSFLVPHTGLGKSPAQLLVLLCAALWLVGLLVRDPAVLRLRHPLAVALVVQVVVAVGGWSIAARTVPFPTVGDDPTAALLRNASLALLALFTMAVLPTVGHVRTALRWLVAVGGVAGLLALLAAVTGVDVAELLRPPGLTAADTIADVAHGLDRAGVARAQGTSAHPLELGAVMTLLVPVALGVAFDARRLQQRSWPALLAAALCGAAAVASVSRSAAVGTAAALVVMGLCWPLARTVRVAAIAVVTGIVLLVLMAAPTQALISSVFAGDPDSSLSSRALGIAYVREHVGQSPWWGQGPGRSGALQPVLDNDYLSVLLDGGVIGLAASVLVLLIALGAALQALRDPAMRELAIGLAGSLTALVVVRSILDVSAFEQVSTLAALLIGLAGAAALASLRPAAAPCPPGAAQEPSLRR